MLRQPVLVICVLAISALLLPATPAAGDAAAGDAAAGDATVEDATVSIDHLGDRLAWSTTFAPTQAVLVVQGPDGAHHRFEASGTVPTWTVDGPDGLYTWELRMVAGSTEPVVSVGADGRRHAGPVDAVRFDGTFRMADGKVVLPTPTPREPVAEPTVPAGERAPTKQLIIGDLSVRNSACVGSACLAAETYGNDTVRLKETTLRMHFQDTSVGAFPSNDWRILINDTASGGANYWSIEDSDASSRPFTLTAGAPNHSLYVNGNGLVGFGTASPLKQLHVVTGDTPTLRLEQDASLGFAAQSWDVAGNEVNFFVRNVDTNTILFKVRPGAGNDALVVDSDGDVGISTGSPVAALDVDRSAASAGSRNMLMLRNNGQASFALMRSDLTPIGGAADNRWSFTHNGTTLDLSKSGTGLNELSLNDNGNLSVRGSFISNGTTLNVPDYVFGPEYELMPLDELAAFVEAHRHLPNVPSAAEVRAGGLDLTAMQLRLLEKVEELTLYTLDLKRTVDRQAAEIEALRASESSRP